MTHFCTVCDYKYLSKGLALYTSLVSNMVVKKEPYYEGDRRNLIEHTPFTLHWLCIDRKTYDKLNELNLHNVRTYSLEHFENEDVQLRAAKNNPPSKYGDQYSQYVWTLTPFFINYLLKLVIPQGELLTYCDADIFFLQSPQLILDTMKDKAIGVHTHRFTTDVETDVGKYNVGVIIFRTNGMGKHHAGMWYGWMLNPNNPYAEKYGTCGDQKYVELLVERSLPENICVFDEQAGIMHLAPWCTHNPENKEPVFFHFSHFRIEGDKWYDSLHSEWNPSADPTILPYYEKYYNTQVDLILKLGL